MMMLVRRDVLVEASLPASDFGPVVVVAVAVAVMVADSLAVCDLVFVPVLRRVAPAVWVLLNVMVSVFVTIAVNVAIPAAYVVAVAVALPPSTLGCTQVLSVHTRELRQGVSPEQQG